MSEYEPDSRAKRHEKQQKQKKKIIFFTSLGAVFCVVLFSLIAFGNKDNQEAENPEKSQAELALKDQKESYEISDHNHKEIEDNEAGEDEKKEKDDDEEEVDEVDMEEADTDDPNVIKAYEGDWNPVGTTQTGDHETNYDAGSQDRKEIRKAVSNVTSIDEQAMTEHWVGNGGDQKVEVTISNGQENYFRVYLSWIDDKGWQATRMEELKNYEK